jgi:hypothetical protein
MFERIVVFIVLGIFVFSPSVSNWWKGEFVSWYHVYLPWFFLILAAIWIQWRTKPTDSAD